MSVKTYGIYLAYPHTVDLRAEGLGRLLAEFLKGARQRGDVRFVIACPSWTRDNLNQLFEASGLQQEDFEILAPARKPLLLIAHQKLVALRGKKEVRKKEDGLRARLRKLRSQVVRRVERYLGQTRSLGGAALLGLLASPLIALGVFLLLLRRAMRKARRLVEERVRPREPAAQTRNGSLGKIAERPGSYPFIVRLYNAMEEAEATLLDDLIRTRTDIAAWFSPTAFWPRFNDIAAPRLMCVPDVVLTDFPVGFAPVGGERFLENFKRVESAVEGGQYFVTYSEDVKWRTLVQRYNVEPENVWVVPHGANRVDDLITVSGFADNDAATTALCIDLFRTALLKAINYGDARIFGSGNVRFMFYASQFRPNKNVLSLLRAYEHLLKRRHLPHKLILTGNPNGLPELKEFIQSHHLENDVLCLHGLSAQELAACYRLADLAVNPSLSEGGCPFTFTEAMSVGTPVVMARIPVTEEVITDPALQEMMLFDPYDWRDMAERIEWCLTNLPVLYERQKPFYDKLAQRAWHDVVDETIDILDSISTEQGEAQCTRARA
ncbi:glycosyltransferase [Noviherbaspirillum sp.]|uniref:glycosyltransferase n=1 Tax=Noviherbaspirillum sp. TaxID=1926288 RepID=UPI002D28CAF7|nr:glycosyltransferase [Noviherbaspirillum sp.]HZW23308.1 glycosyltransferase [Noviherbaspirillum sp.]